MNRQLSTNNTDRSPLERGWGVYVGGDEAMK